MVPLHRSILASFFFASLWVSTSLALTVQPGHSGTWGDPDQSGHGLLIQVISDTQAVVFWFTFDDQGNRDWIGGVGTIEGDQIVVETFQISGGFFPPDFDPTQIGSTVWGTMIITFFDCESGEISWASVLDGYLDGTMDLIKVTAVDSLQCEPDPSINGLAIPFATNQPTLDGAIGANEWTDAVEVQIEISPGWVVPVSLMADGQNIYVLFENLAGPGGVNDVSAAQNDTLFPELFIDADFEGPDGWDNATRWFHASFQDCYAPGSWNQTFFCNFDLAQWDATNWPLLFEKISEISVSYGRLGLTPGEPATIGLMLSMTSALLGFEVYHNYPTDAQAADPQSWMEVMLPPVP